MSSTTEDMFPDDDASQGTNGFGGELEVHNGDAGTLEVFPPARNPLSEARSMLAEHRAMLDDAYYTANVVCQTPLAPQRYRGKAKEGTVAIMYGAELGLPPMASLQKVINIHGSPSIEARTMKGLLKAKGFQFRTVTKTDTEFEIHAWEPSSDKRVDPPDEVAHWTIERAIKARYVPQPSSEDSARRPDVEDDWVTVSKTWDGKAKKSVVGNMKYITDPTGMLEAKGTAEVCRGIAPEILMGLPYAAEERDDWSDSYDDAPEEEAPRRRTRAKGVNALRDRAKAAKQPEPQEPQDAEVVDDHIEVTPAGAGGSGHAGAPHLAPGGDGGGGSAVAQGGQAGTWAATTVAEPEKPEEGEGAAPPAVPEQPAAAADDEPQLELAPDPGPAAAATPEPEAALPDPAATAPAEEPAAGPAPTPPQPEPAAAPAAAQPADGGLAMSPEMRAKGERMLDNLLAEAKVEDAEDRQGVVAEVAAKGQGATYRPIPGWATLTNAELKYVVDVLRARKQKGDLYDYCGEALNASALREAGLTEGK